MSLFNILNLFFSIFFGALCSADQLVIWNVGQGQWITEVRDQYCSHYDLGGEKNPVVKVLRLCGQKINRLYITHWDWDHISFIKDFKLQARKICLAQKPFLPDFKKEKLLSDLPPCEKKGATVNILPFLKHGQKLRPNDSSNVFLIADWGVLIPGDSTTAQEKHWLQKIDEKKVRTLILGHHGSRTSSGEELFKQLKHLKLTASSSRFAKYHHPHPLIVKRIQFHRIPLLTSETWGDIHLQF